jgi:hypothetical protein|tara:strand:- start:275 stop:496 length:222 start_codon:yes stop_codon:yes gene_type:complete
MKEGRDMTFTKEMLDKKLKQGTIAELEVFKTALQRVTTLDAEVFNVLDGNSFIELIRLQSDVKKIIKEKRKES